MSKKQLNENFIYKFQLKHKITSVKKSQTSALKIFNKFLLYYISLNQRKKPSFPRLNILKYEFKETKKSFYYFIVTNPYTNHPFTVYGDYNSDTVNIIIPVGREIGQFNINKINKELKKLTKDNIIALKYLLLYTIKLRKFNFLNQKNPENKFFNCNNIYICGDKIKDVYKYEKNTQIQMKLIEKIYSSSFKTIINNINDYFDSLKNSKFTEAKKKLNIIKNQYISPKDIVGHLAILTDIYKLYIKIK